MPWEDGHRTSGKLGEYEWWYLDVKLDNGGTLVLQFHTQPVTASSFTYEPCITLTFDDGDFHVEDSRSYSKKECIMLRDKCFQQYGESYFKGNLDTYDVHAQLNHICVDIHLTKTTSAWRPETGHFLFGEKNYFAWLPAVPEGDARVTVTIDGKTQSYTGTGYHDHNWGNKGMFWLIHHWYWGRAKVGPYSVISSYITARENYGSVTFPIFMLAKNGEKIADRPEFVHYQEKDLAFDPVTKKHYYSTLIYDYNDTKQHYTVTYQVEKLIDYFTVADSKTSKQTKASDLLLVLVKIAKLEPSYIRFSGTVKLERFENHCCVEAKEASAVWEQMHFGLDQDLNNSL